MLQLMTNREALEAFARKERLDQPTIRRLLEMELITASDVTTMETPPGQQEYLPIAITSKGQRLLDKAKKRDANRSNSRNRKNKPLKWLRKQVSRFEMKAALGVVLALVPVLSLYLYYKYTGADDLRNKVYSPLNAELSTIESSLTAHNMSAPFQSTTLSSLKQSGDFYRISKSLRGEITAFYDDAGKIPASVASVTELLQRQFSTRIQALRSEQSDAVWRAGAVSRIREQERQRPGISTIQSFTFNHAFIGRGVDVRDPNHPTVSTPGGPIWQINDWLAYPDSIAKIESIWTTDDYLYCDDRDVWYYRITRDDLQQHKITLKEFFAAGIRGSNKGSELPDDSDTATGTA